MICRYIKLIFTQLSINHFDKGKDNSNIMKWRKTVIYKLKEDYRNMLKMTTYQRCPLKIFCGNFISTWQQIIIAQIILWWRFIIFWNGVLMVIYCFILRVMWEIRIWDLLFTLETHISGTKPRKCLTWINPEPEMRS